MWAPGLLYGCRLWKCFHFRHAIPLSLARCWRYCYFSHADRVGRSSLDKFTISPIRPPHTPGVAGRWRSPVISAVMTRVKMTKWNPVNSSKRPDRLKTWEKLQTNKRLLFLFDLSVMNSLISCLASIWTSFIGSQMKALSHKTQCFLSLI